MKTDLFMTKLRRYTTADKDSSPCVVSSAVICDKNKQEVYEPQHSKCPTVLQKNFFHDKKI